MNKTDAGARITQTNIHANERAGAGRFLLRMFAFDLKLTRDTCLSWRRPNPESAQSNHRPANFPTTSATERILNHPVFRACSHRKSRQWFFAAWCVSLVGGVAFWRVRCCSRIPGGRDSLLKGYVRYKLDTTSSLPGFDFHLIYYSVNDTHQIDRKIVNFNTLNAMRRVAGESKTNKNT